MTVSAYSSILSAARSASTGAATKRPQKRATKQLSTDQGPIAAPYWGDNGELWDVVRLAGIALPGVATVTGKGFEQRVDRRVIPGTKGKRMTSFGCDPADIEIELQLYEPEHLEALKKLISIIKPKNGKAEAHSIYHPALDLYGIRSVLVLSSSLPAMRRGVMGVTLRCVEHVQDQASATVAKVAQGPDAADSMAGGAFKNAYRDKLSEQDKRNAQKPSATPGASAP